MVTTDKVQTGDSTASTSTSTTWRCPYTPSKAEQGWECPRCGKINAPWKSQCDCSGNNWTITTNWTYKPDWWKEVTCQGTKTVLDSDTFKVHPDSTIYQVGGSDYKVNDTYVNVGGTQSNTIDPNSVTTAWNSSTDLKKYIDDIQTQIDKLKENK